jgi:MFS family permease
MESVPEGSAVQRRLTSLAVDVTPLRESREFRLLFIGQGVSFAGSMITYVAIPFQTYELTRSSLVVGLVSLAELVPILVMSFVGGALADRGRSAAHGAHHADQRVRSGRRAGCQRCAATPTALGSVLRCRRRRRR